MEILELHEEIPIQYHSIYLKFSPNMQYLAMAGINYAEQPVLYIADISSRIVIHQEVFSGSYIYDFSWSPDSNQIMASLINQSPEGVFNGQLFVVDPFQAKNSFLLSRKIQAAVVRIKWIQKDQVISLEYSCREAEKATDNFGDGYTLGRSSVGLVSVNLQNQYSQKMELSSDGSKIDIVISPDKEQILYIRAGVYGLYPPVNQLLQASSLNVLPCSFCDGFRGVLWFGHHIIGDAPILGLPDGNIYLVDTQTGESSLLGQYGTQGPVWRELEIGGKTILISAAGGHISATDFTSCLEEGADFNDCEQDVWELEGAYVDSLDDRTLPGLTCCTPEEGCI
jgi:hypothetical protein